MKVLGVYFSGTGNTRHCVETFVDLCGYSRSYKSIESKDVLSALANHDDIVLGYPIYYSNAPKIMQDFVTEHGHLFSGKKVFILCTMAMWSGDGSGCMARKLTKLGATIVGGLHLRMPDSIADEKVLKKDDAGNRTIIAKADVKLADAASKYIAGSPPKDGLGFPAHLAGLLGQRLWFYGKTTSYKRAPKVNKEKCFGCRCCSELCPMQNIELVDKKAVSHDRCTLCYRCVNHCPAQALTILGKKIHSPYSYARYEP